MAFPDCKLIVQSMRWCDSPPTRRVGHRPRVVSVTAHALCRSPPARRVGHRPRVVSGDSPPTRRVGRSDGSYLEDQDHWWLSGIHRDVWLYRKPLVHLAPLAMGTPACKCSPRRPLLFPTGAPRRHRRSHCAHTKARRRVGHFTATVHTKTCRRRAGSRGARGAVRGAAAGHRYPPSQL